MKNKKAFLLVCDDNYIDGLIAQINSINSSQEDKKNTIHK